MTAGYQHVLDTIHKGVADQVGGLLWDTPKPDPAADDGQDGGGSDGPAGGPVSA